MILTERLDLLPATSDLIQAAIEGPPTLAEALSAEVPDSWPPEFLDVPALEYTAARLGDDHDQARWWMYFALLRRATGGRILIGGAGYKGPPSGDGTVEVGYGIVSDQRRQGFAAEATRGLLTHAFGVPAVQRAIAETLPELVGSIGVLRVCGFSYIGPGSEPGVIRYELTRTAWLARSGA